MTHWYSTNFTGLYPAWQRGGHRSPLTLLMLTLTLLVATMPSASAVAPNHDEDVIVMLDPGLDPGQVAREMGVTPTFIYDHVFNGFAGRLATSRKGAAERRRGVRSISRDQAIHGAAQRLPSGIDRIDGDLNPDAAIDGVDARVDVDVAVVDTGIANHRDLNVAGGVSCISDSYRDRNGHGTHVAGIIGAIDNGRDVVGVAPGARLWAVKVLNQDNNGFTSTVICGLNWIVAHAATNDIDVANMSLSGPGTDNVCGTNVDPLHEAICAVVAAGIPVVVAAGNEEGDAQDRVPAAYDEVITVSAFADTDRQPGGLGARCGGDFDDTFATYSDFGADVDIAAPGNCIRSTWVHNKMKRISGTSAAAPHVTGAVALYLAANPNATPADVRAWLLTTGSRPQNSAVGFTGDPDGTAEPVVYLGP